MMKYFHALGIREHDEILYEMGIKEKEHEVYFLEQIKNSHWLPYFEKVFAWGKNTAANDVDMANKLSVAASSQYCKNFKAKEVEEANLKAGTQA
jgi:hypothetical protein